ncbi:MAG TPA: SpoIIE family protein phosphatase [Polyangiaceae bacterium]|nr:SpoIIE family protein phosphatase [Polyangiaceae bacterium]
MKRKDSGRRLLSLEVRLASVTSLVLVLVSAGLFVELSSRERGKLISAKTGAATMLIQLLSIELAPAVDFGDTNDVAARLADVRANPDIVAAGVWSDVAKPPLSEWRTAEAPPLAPPQDGAPDGTRVSTDFLVVTSTMLGPSGGKLGRVALVFTLRPENEAFRRDRRTLFLVTAVLTAFTAALLALLARRYVVGPLGRLARAATSLADGDTSARVDIRSDDEMGDLARAFNVMGEAVRFREERLQKEIELAQRIQTSILPRNTDVPGLEIAARMVPASEVGGDYYDVLPVPGGAWIGIGDVAGHGLDAGLMMLMMQSIVSSLVKWAPAAPPRDVIVALNEVLYENIKVRLGRDDHATLSVMHYAEDGKVTFAGAHEDLIVWRALTKKVEFVETPGTWVGGRRDIRPGTTDSELRLNPGDVVVLYTDGVTEIRDSSGQDFGVERLAHEVERVAERPTAEILEHLVTEVGNFGNAEDDVTVVVLRYVGSAA